MELVLVFGLFGLMLAALGVLGLVGALTLRALDRTLRARARRRDRRQAVPGPVCAACGYPTHGHRSEHCPECGASLADPAAVRTLRSPTVEALDLVAGITLLIVLILALAAGLAWW